MAFFHLLLYNNFTCMFNHILNHLQLHNVFLLLMHNVSIDHTITLVLSTEIRQDYQGNANITLQSPNWWKSVPISDKRRTLTSSELEQRKSEEECHDAAYTPMQFIPPLYLYSKTVCRGMHYSLCCVLKYRLWVFVRMVLKNTLNMFSAEIRKKTFPLRRNINITKHG